jgi:hypothetical protein
MPALNQNLELWTDRTSIVDFPIYQVDGVTPYTATTPTTANWVMGVNARSTAVLAFGTPPITITQDAQTGLWTATLFLLPAMWAGIRPGNYYHEMSILDNAGDAVNTTIGTINLQPSLFQGY